MQQSEPIPFRLADAAADEELIPLTRAAAVLPCRRKGRPTNVATVYAWTLRGCRGHRLRYVQVGGTRCTTRAWLAEFFERLTQTPEGPVASAESRPACDGPATDRAVKEAAEAGRRLERKWEKLRRP